MMKEILQQQLHREQKIMLLHLHCMINQSINIIQIEKL